MKISKFLEKLVESNVEFVFNGIYLSFNILDLFKVFPSKNYCIKVFF